MNDSVAPAAVGGDPRPSTPDPRPSQMPDQPIVCDICGSKNVQEIQCKVICRNCGTVLKSCEDL